MTSILAGQLTMISKNSFELIKRGVYMAEQAVVNDAGVIEKLKEICRL